MALPITAVPFYLEMHQNDQTTNPPNNQTSNALFGIVLLERQGKGVCGDKIATRSDIMAEKGLRHVI